MEPKIRDLSLIYIGGFISSVLSEAKLTLGAWDFLKKKGEHIDAFIILTSLFFIISYSFLWPVKFMIGIPKNEQD